MSWNPAGYSQFGHEGTERISSHEHRKVYLTRSVNVNSLLFCSSNGSLHLFYMVVQVRCLNDLGDRILVDDGMTRSEPQDMTERLKPDGMVWDAVGPGTGIQTKLGERAGRLVIPAIGRNIYSDDHGQHWKYQTMVHAPHCTSSRMMASCLTVISFVMLLL